LMSKGANLVKYTKDEVILKEGSINRDFYRIKEGKVRVDKSRSEGGVLTIVTMSKDMMFGEISMLQASGMVSASIVADDTCELFQLNANNLKKLFESENALSERFYRELALKQALRLTQARQRIEEVLEKEGDSALRKERRQSRTRTNSFALPTNNKASGQFAKLFGLGADEPCVLALPCRWKRALFHSGTLYISQNYICAAYSFFALKIKHIIPFKEISNMEGEKSKLEFRLNSLKEKKVVIQMQTEDEFKQMFELVNLCWKEVNPRGTIASSANMLLTQSSLNPINLPQMTEVDQALSDALTADDWKLLLDKCKQIIYEKKCHRHPTR